AKQIGGDKVDVHSVMRGPENVHNVMGKPTEMVFLNKADLFVHSGLDAEPWRDNLLKGARNPRVMPNKPGNVDMSNGIELLEVPGGQASRAEGDIHAYGNPHYTLSPTSAQRMTVTLAKAMMTADPANAGLYKENARKVVGEFAALHRELKEKLAPLGGLKIVTYHKAWSYFAQAFDLDIVGVIEPKVGITPSPGDIKRTIDLMKREGVKVVVVETYNSLADAKIVADAAGATAIVLPDHVNGIAEADSYQKLLRYDVEKLIEAAHAR
ncbi:MAG: zinc/manganese transport system substrate-binding protein, partial [Humisphaera sp.]|nr:zinc/manganese transport system substrate-binding protein [Humisphaera sp.]